MNGALHCKNVALGGNMKKEKKTYLSLPSHMLENSMQMMCFAQHYLPI